MVRHPISQVRYSHSLIYIFNIVISSYRQRFGQSNGATPFVPHDVEVGHQASAQCLTLINPNRHMNLFDYADKIENAALTV
jgi:hypothetical protein